MSLDTPTDPATDTAPDGAAIDTAPDGAETGDAADVQLLAVTDAALETVLGIRDGEDDPASLALRVEITGSRGSEFTYDLSFEELDAVGDDHERIAVGDLQVVIPRESVDRLRGSELDLSRTGGGGLVIRNPNRPDPLAGIDLELTGDLPEKVQQLLDQAVNPALGSHGGYATLVGVDEENRVFVTMGGGCQGCAASAATLTEGIKRSIMDALPEVADVVDATDHAAGVNPFYT